MLSLCLFVSFFVRFAAPLSTEDFFYYPEKRFCASGGCLDFEDDGVMVVDGEPFPFYGRQSNRVVVSVPCYVFTLIYAVQLLFRSLCSHRNEGLLDIVAAATAAFKGEKF